MDEDRTIEDNASPTMAKISTDMQRVLALGFTEARERARPSGVGMRPLCSVRIRAAGSRIASLVALVVSALLALSGAGGCSRRAPNATPDGAVRELIERMHRVQGDPDDTKAAYVLLSKRARANLAARAQRYSAASGKAIAPEAMLVPSRFLLRFEPQRYSAQIAGAHALVVVEGLRLEDRAQIPCIFEEDAWKVDLVLPSLPPVQMRPGTSG